MEKLIELDAALDAIGGVPDYDDGMVFEALSHAQRNVALLPTVDAVPVKHGMWRQTATGWIYCSVCGNEPPEETNSRTDYCPNCCADMRGEQDG